MATDHLVTVTAVHSVVLVVCSCGEELSDALRTLTKDKPDAQT